jgi:hypothetical protein
MFYRNREKREQRSGAALDLMQKVRALLEDDGSAVVSVGEHGCGDAECCGPGTVVLVMRPDQPTKAAKLNKPLDGVTEADLAALVPLLSNTAAPQAAVSGDEPDGSPVPTSSHGVP